MADPIILQMFNNFVTTLKGITVANGFFSEVGTDHVEEVLKLWTEVNIRQMPFLGVSIMKSPNTELAAEVLTPVVRVKVIGHVYDPENGATGAALKLEDDVIAAIYADHTRGPHSDGDGTRNAMWSRWIETLYDFRDPQKGPKALIEMNWDVKLERTTAGS